MNFIRDRPTRTVDQAPRERAMDNLAIDTADVLSRFDRLVMTREILWTPTTPLALTHEGFQFEFRVCTVFASKPQIATAASHPPANGAPQSDIRNISQDFHIASLSPPGAASTHSFTLNAYSAFRPQYLILTVSPSHSQRTPLDRTDLAAAWAALSALGPSHWAIYNCGPEAGCSRLHKHMQIYPPSTSEFCLFPDRAESTAEEGVPFRYFLRRFEPAMANTSSADEVADLLLTTYHDLLCLTRSALRVPPSETWVADPVPHNVVLVLGWMMVIPRTRAAVGGVSANAAAMMGLVCVKSESEVEEWKKRGPAGVLGGVGIPTGCVSRN